MNLNQIFTDEHNDLLVAVRALAIIMQQVAAEGPEVKEALGNLDMREKEALKEFQGAAERCLGQLKGWTLLSLENVGLDVKSTTRQRNVGREMSLKLGEDEKTVYQQFEKLDNDKDGLLDFEEFKGALKELSDGEVTDDNATKMIETADVNRNGKIDIHEFVVWLYATEGKVGKSDDVAPSVESLQEKLKEVETELNVKTRAFNRLESQHEYEIDAIHDFWKSVAKHAVLNIDKKVDLETAEWLGNGKYGFVLKASRHRDKRELVVKMMGLRWAHLAVKEWKSGTMVGSHDNVVEYEEVMLHADNDRSVQKLLVAGYESGALKSKKKRSVFPDRYICLTQELMNRGTVQDWIDTDILLPGGEFVIMQKVARGLAFMHQKKVTHNDIKPENIMLHEQDDGTILVKLGDLGLATDSKDVFAQQNDFWQYGMTAFCMLTTEKFGTRKYRKENVEGMCEELSKIVKESGSEGKLLTTYEDMPGLLSNVFLAEVEFKEVRDWPSLQGWDFFEGGSSVDMAPDTNPIAHCRHRTKADGSKLKKLQDLTVAHACESMK